MSQTVHHGGAWKVAFADFVTALMALFIVLWLVGQSPETKAAVAAYFNNPSIFPGEGRGFLSQDGAIQLHEQLHEIEVRRAAQGGGDENQQTGTTSELQQLEQEFLLDSAKQIENALESSATLSEFDGQVSVEMTAEGLRIQVHDEEMRPLFASGSDQVTPETQELLTAIAHVLADMPNPIVVEGHTDSRPFQSGDKTNWELSAERANAARKILEANGIDPTRVTRVVGYADRNLLEPDRPFSTRNRRISFIVRYQNGNH
ncbi:MAG: OmpA family protein [Candidatus Eisenbacteria bacterium]|uniref:OmpA family protein n=1 Tax=Eiseniibacteriota bacterium TaxID=2212470 RepID=A0A956NC07_UNCEI|nr:OmpA family protein [Candidatus Eisenbacteria bacterium]